MKAAQNAPNVHQNVALNWQLGISKLSWGCRKMLSSTEKQKNVNCLLQSEDEPL